MSCQIHFPYQYSLHYLHLQSLCTHTNNLRWQNSKLIVQKMMLKEKYKVCVSCLSLRANHECICLQDFQIYVKLFVKTSELSSILLARHLFVLNAYIATLCWPCFAELKRLFSKSASDQELLELIHLCSFLCKTPTLEVGL